MSALPCWHQLRPTRWGQASIVRNTSIAGFTAILLKMMCGTLPTDAGYDPPNGFAWP